MADDGPVTALLLGGGAPTLTLQSGALAALHEHGVKFDVVSTAGAGMLIGLLYAAPRGRSPAEALAQTKEMGVHDGIYEHFPINFKVFQKPGTLAEGYRRWLQSLPRMAPGPSEIGRLWGRLDGAAARHLVPVRPRPAEPRAVRPCAVDRRGGRLRQAEGVQGRVLHERLLHR